MARLVARHSPGNGAKTIDDGSEEIGTARAVPLTEAWSIECSLSTRHVPFQ